MDEHHDVELEGVEPSGHVALVAERLGVPRLGGCEVGDVQTHVVEAARAVVSHGH
jgi:hypothetical protein